MSDIPWAVRRRPVIGYGQVRNWALRRIAACIWLAQEDALDGVTFGRTGEGDYITPTSTTTAVYTALAAFKDYGGEGGARPGQATIGKLAGVSRKTVGRHLKLLHALGVVDWDSRAGPRGTHEYTLPSEPRPVRNPGLHPVETRKDFDEYEDGLDGWEHPDTGDARTQSIS